MKGILVRLASVRRSIEFVVLICALIFSISVTLAAPINQQGEICRVSALDANGAKLRNGPSLTSRWMSSLMLGNSLEVDGQTLGNSDGIVWWRTTYYGLWVRSTAVSESGNCEAIPVITIGGSNNQPPVPTGNSGSGQAQSSPTPVTPTEPPMPTPLSVSVHSIGAPGSAASRGCIAIATIAGTGLNSGHICIQNNTVQDCNYPVSGPGNYVIDFGGVGQAHHVWVETNIGTAEGGTFVCQY